MPQLVVGGHNYLTLIVSLSTSLLVVVVCVVLRQLGTHAGEVLLGRQLPECQLSAPEYKIDI